ncbi:MAG: long-chain fatty acid--CoA ligase [Calditrichaeota bacterium]|nr:long-chain fatty acid--CoA ligase [Calditrichota bacterium]
MTELKTLKDVLEFIHQEYPDRPAATFVGAQPITFEEFYQKAKRLSVYLQEEGVTKGDHVAILSESMPHWSIAYFAITSMGAVAVPILPDFHQNEVQHIIRHARCKAIFVSENQYPKIEDTEFETLKEIIFINDFVPLEEANPKDPLKEIIDRGSKEISKIKQAALKLAQKEEPAADISPDDLAVIIYTSGTTGHSKGVMLTHGNIVSNALSILQIVDISVKDRLLSVLPLSHAYECTIGMVAPFIKGACIHYLDKPPTPRLLLSAFQKVRPTIMLIVPLIIEKIYKTRIVPQLNGKWILRNIQKIPGLRKLIIKKAGQKLLQSFGGELKYLPIGGALLAPDVEKFLYEAGVPYAVGYGLTETSPLAAAMIPGMIKLRSTGPPVPGVQIKIDNPDPETGVGEIWIKGPNVMKGYYKDPEQTAKVLTEDGWFKTGDLGLLDEDNYLFIKGRIKNMILGPSGENIYPEQIEAVINEFEYVSESLVYEDQGKIVARVFLNYEEIDRLFGINHLSETKVKEKIKELLETIRRQSNERLSAHSRISRIIEQTEPFEKTPTQKTKRYLYVNS